MLPAVAIHDGLVAGAAEGETRARNELLTALTPQSRLMVAARLSAHPDRAAVVEDLAQCVLMDLAAGIAKLEIRTVAGLMAFVSTIASRRVADLLRGRGLQGIRRGPAVSLDSTVAAFAQSGPLWQFLSAPGTSPLSAVDRAEQVARILTEMGQMKEEHRDVITYAFFDQLSTLEIAARMSISRRAASMLLLRALNALRRRLGEAATPLGGSRASDEEA